MIEGDGIGPEIAQSVKDIFEAAKVTIRRKLDLAITKAVLTLFTGPHQVGARRCRPHSEGRQDRYS
jgi:isocitrate/isopropylmalate dehydrogenase